MRPRREKPLQQQLHRLRHAAVARPRPPLRHVVFEANRAEPQERREHDQHVAACQVAPQEGGDHHAADHDRPAHHRRPRLVEGRPDARLAQLVHQAATMEIPDEARRDDQREDDGGQRRADGADASGIRTAAAGRARPRASESGRRAGRSPGASFPVGHRVNHAAVEPLDLELRLEVGGRENELLRDSPSARHGRPLRRGARATGCPPSAAARTIQYFASLSASSAGSASWVPPILPSASAAAAATSSQRSSSSPRRPSTTASRSIRRSASRDAVRTASARASKYGSSNDATAAPAPPPASRRRAGRSP